MTFIKILSPTFEQDVLLLHHLEGEEELSGISPKPIDQMIDLEGEGLTGVQVPYNSAKGYSVLVGLPSEEIQRYISAYEEDPHFSKVRKTLSEEKDWSNPQYPQYSSGEEGLLYFEDYLGNLRLCVPRSLRPELMGQIHENLNEGP